MNHNITETASGSGEDAEKSILPEAVLNIIQDGIKEGFKNGHLDLHQCNINDSMMHELCEWINKLGDKVGSLILSYNQITSDGASALFDSLKANNLLINKIFLSYNSLIDDKCMKSLGEYIKSNKNIQGIDLSYCTISDAGIEMLVPYVDGNRTFKRLNIDGYKGITDKSVPFLVKMIESSSMEDLHTYFTSLTQTEVFAVPLAQNLLKNGTNRIGFHARGVNDEYMIKICESMKKYGIVNVKEIDFGRNSITSKGAISLFKTLEESDSQLTQIILSDNRLDDECMKEISNFLQYDQHVRALYLNKNSFTDKSIEMLSKHLIDNSTLKTLDVSANRGITEKSIPNFLEIARKSGIVDIDVAATCMPIIKQDEIKKVFTIPIDQREMPIISNSKSAAKS